MGYSWDPSEGISKGNTIGECLDSNILEIQEFGQAIHLPAFRDLEFVRSIQDYGRFLALAVYGEMLGKTKKTIRYPETWWDAVKLRFYPKFLLNKFPVNFVIEQVTVWCPHIGVKDLKKHESFLIEKIRS